MVHLVGFTVEIQSSASVNLMYIGPCIIAIVEE